MCVYLRLYIQQCNLALVMNLLDSFNLGAKHAALKTSVFQKLVSHDAFGHLVIGDEIILLSVFFVFPLRSGCVWLKEEMFQHHTSKHDGLMEGLTLSAGLYYGIWRWCLIILHLEQ